MLSARRGPTRRRVIERGSALKLVTHSMRARAPVMILAAAVGTAALVVPVALAISLDVPPPMSDFSRLAIHPAPVPMNVSVVAAAPVAPVQSIVPQVPDGAKFLLVGSALFGLAAAVRRVV